MKEKFLEKEDNLDEIISANIKAEIENSGKAKAR